MFHTQNLLLVRFFMLTKVQILSILLACVALLISMTSLAGGGPLGIDHELSSDGSDIWDRKTQTALLDGLVVAETGCGLWEGSDVATVTAVVTPFILQYSNQHPAIWALETLPIYDGIAATKVQAHWQTDVLTGFAIGSAFGYYANNRDKPVIINVMRHGIFIGWKKEW